MDGSQNLMPIHIAVEVTYDNSRPFDHERSLAHACGAHYAHWHFVTRLLGKMKAAIQIIPATFDRKGEDRALSISYALGFLAVLTVIHTEREGATRIIICRRAGDSSPAELHLGQHQ